MAQKTKEQLKSTLTNGHLVTGSDFTDLIDSLKGLQTAVSDPSAAGTSVTFIATISQNEEGVITATKKSVSFSGYQPVAGMANYQDGDLQKVGDITEGAGGSETITHNMKHYPTVMLMDANTGVEVKAGEYVVTHVDNMDFNS